MFGMGAASQTLTVAEFYRRRDADPDPHNRYELIDGELFVTRTAGPPHQRLLGRVSYRVGEIVGQHERASQFHGPIDVRDGDRSVVQPDLLVLLGERTSFETAQDVAGPPNLVVEVLSQWTEEIDRGEKPLFYARLGSMSCGWWTGSGGRCRSVPVQ